MGEYKLIENNSKTYYNGSKWCSKNCSEFTIIGKTNRYQTNKRNKKTYRHFLCEFQDGTIIEAHSSHIKTGYVKNPNLRSLCGVGYLGQGEWTSIDNGKISKEYVVWSEMIRRCYSSKAPEKFPAYIDVTVCERWHCFQNFYEDIRYLKGYNEWKKGDVKYNLDKDILCKEMGVIPKIYSPDTCMFITEFENISESTSRKNLTGLIYIGISPDNKKYEFINQLEFSKEHGLNNCLVNECIHNKIDNHKGWTFKVKE